MQTHTGQDSRTGEEEAGRRMVSLRLSREARALLARLAGGWGVSQAAVLEMLLRKAADGAGWDAPSTGPPRSDRAAQ